jgi:hypothetical protein
VPPTRSTAGQIGDGVPDFTYDAATGDVHFTSDGLPPGEVVSEITLDSASAALLPGGDLLVANGLNSISPRRFEAIYLATIGFNGDTDLGRILPAGLTLDQLMSDTTVKFQVLNHGLAGPGDWVMVTSDPTPPPEILSAPPGPGTGRPAAPSALGTTGDGVPDFIYDPSTGDVTFNRDGLDSAGHVMNIFVSSVSGSLLPAQSNLNDGSSVNTPGVIEGLRANPTQFPDTFDMGAILPAHLTQEQLTSDTSIGYRLFGSLKYHASTWIIAQN